MKHFSLAVILILLSMLDSEALVTRPGQDRVDWSRGLVISHGTWTMPVSKEGMPVDGDGNIMSINRGRMEAYRRARENAVENMVRMMKGIRVDADTTLVDLLERSETARGRIMGVVNGRVKVSEYPLDFVTSACRAELRIGDILQAVPYTYPGDEFPTRLDNPIPTRYSSLVIDARGLAVEPMILPSVFSETGIEVYSRYRVDIRNATKYGIVAYATTQDEAMKNRLAGDRPFYTVALREVKGCPVISDRDVRKILSSPESIEQLKKCRVIFIIDKNWN
ncbi:MAG: hypothetical protein JXA07_05215 [Spirochaetes bacterium]|nr:hypothetical protein [Spirochaetota bacterium]